VSGVVHRNAAIGFDRAAGAHELLTTRKPAP
jgi:hypothetical protein